MAQTALEAAFEKTAAQAKYYQQALMSYASMAQSPIVDNSQYYDIYQAWIYANDIYTGYRGEFNSLISLITTDILVPVSIGEWVSITIPKYGSIVFQNTLNVNGLQTHPFIENNLALGGFPEGTLVHTYTGMYEIVDNELVLKIPVSETPLNTRM